VSHAAAGRGEKDVQDQRDQDRRLRTSAQRLGSGSDGQDESDSANVDLCPAQGAPDRAGEDAAGQSRSKKGVVEQQAMRNGQHQHHGHNKRMRGRNNQHSNNNNNNNRRNHNPLTRVYESNGPDVKIRGTANHVAEKYLQLARDAQSSGDPIAAENYFQHAEHYFRLIAAAQEQFRQQNPNFQPPRPEGGSGNDQQFQPRQEENFDEEGGGQDSQPFVEAPFGRGEPQPYIQPNPQPFQPRDNQNFQPREQRNNGQPQGERQPRPQPQSNGNHEGGGLPAFITGGASQPVPQEATAQDGQENGESDRFPLHRRRRRHRGPRNDAQGGNQPDDSGA
jgi:hypothetical protein